MSLCARTVFLDGNHFYDIALEFYKKNETTTSTLNTYIFHRYKYVKVYIHISYVSMYFVVGTFITYFAWLLKEITEKCFQNIVFHFSGSIIFVRCKLNVCKI